MSNYLLEDINDAISHKSYWWSELSDQPDGYVTALLVCGEPVVITKVAGKEGDYEGGDNQDVFVVIKVGTQYFKKTGYFTSHSGSTWNSTLREVHPVTKTVTVFE